MALIGRRAVNNVTNAHTIETAIVDNAEISRVARGVSRFVGVFARSSESIAGAGELALIGSSTAHPRTSSADTTLATGGARALIAVIAKRSVLNRGVGAETGGRVAGAADVAVVVGIRAGDR
jgi:hypothetical protein